MEKKNTNYYIVSLTLCLLIVNIFRDKIIYLAPTLNISISLLIYPITFLLIILIYNKYKMTKAKESVLMSALFVLLFYLICTVICSINSITDSNLISSSLREILTPNHFELYNVTFYYPDILPLLSSTLIYIITHYIMLITYETTNLYTNYFISFIISILISFIIDQMLYIPFINLFEIINGELSFIELIKIMTSHFLIVIITSILLMFIYPLTKSSKD